MTPTSVTRDIRLGTRASELARTQSALVGEALAARSGREWTEVLIRTRGDDTTQPLNQPGSPGLFVSALRDALLDKQVDVVVHSYKDLPSAPCRGITVGAVPHREDPRDALVSGANRRLEDLPSGAVVGTSSPRRAASLRAIRPDLVIAPIRGNVDSRVRKVRDGEFDATILAVAGLRRIGRDGEIAQIFDADEMLSAPAQGALAVECRSDDDDMIALLASIDDAVSRIVTAAEREVLVGIGASCTSAVGAHARFVDGTLTLRAELFDEHGIEHAVAERTAPIALADVVSARALGLRTAAELLGAVNAPPVLLIRTEGNERDADSLARRAVGSVCDPYVQITPAPGDALLALLRADAGSWIVVTSPMAVPSWTASVGADALREALVGRRAAATGRRTAETLRALGCTDVLVPEVASAQGLLDAMADIPPQSAVFARGNLALRTLPDGLRELGWQVAEGVVYETETVTQVPASVELIRQRDVAAIVLRSPSAVRALTSFTTPHPSIPIICAGTVTADAARAHGLQVTAIASSPDSESVARAVWEALESRGP